MTPDDRAFSWRETAAIVGVLLLSAASGVLVGLLLA